MTIRPLSPELAEKARQELNEDQKRISSDLEHIKDWIAKQPHLNARTDDQWLIAFLRGCKFSLERTKEKLDLYYSLRSVAPDLYRLKPNDALFREILDVGAYVILPKSGSSTSPRINLIRPGAYDPDKIPVMDVLSMSNTLEKLLLLEDDATVVSGIVSIIDLEGVTMSHFLQMTPTVIKKMVVLSQLYVHNKNYDEMYKYIPKEVLPVEYGGNGGTFREILEYWKAKLEERSSWLEEDLKYGTDESKRLGQPNTAEGLFGLDGSFRKLEFD